MFEAARGLCLVSGSSCSASSGRGVGDTVIASEEWGRQKTRSLLKLLLARPGRSIPRDEILEALWPGASPGPQTTACERR